MALKGEDPKKQFEEISKLTLKEMESASRSGVMSAAKALKKNARACLVSAIPNAIRPSKKWPFMVVEGVMISKYHKGDVTSAVHLMGHRDAPGTHRLRWLANGTQDRYHKSGKWVGKIKPTPFFQQAILMTPIYDIMEDACSKAIARLNKYK